MGAPPMRWFVTGITGFVGARLAGALVEAGDAVAGIHVNGPQPAPVADAWEVDLTDAAAVAEAVERARPDVIVHLGSLSHVGDSWGRMADYFRVNVLGTENVLAAARRGAGDLWDGNDRSVPVVFASSAEVYGAVPEDEQPLAESRPLAPASPYALTKAAGERLVLAGGGTAVRLFNLVGAGQQPRFALPTFARQLAAIAAGRAEPVLAVGNLAARRDFVHAGDGVAALLRLGRVAAAGRGGPGRNGQAGGEVAGQVYNVACGRAWSIQQVLERLMAVAGVEARVEVDPARLRPVDVPLLCGDARRLRALGWEPRHTLDDALAEVWKEACAAVAGEAAPAGAQRGEAAS
ncbi:MAG TPA: GDP-mannose 4,6-dehydratase [Thermoanaerobaculia bacterium]|nr:GDP-mannose 4,6-dehydratase [Thermoanaerobaculia bacterium]